MASAAHTRHVSFPIRAETIGAQLTAMQGSDTESTGPASPRSDLDMTWDDAENQDVEHSRTEATFAHIDSTRELTLEEREKWK